MYTKYSRIFSVGRYQSFVAVGLLVWGFTSYQWYFSYSTAIVGGSYDHKKWNEQKHEAPFSMTQLQIAKHCQYAIGHMTENIL